MHHGLIAERNGLNLAVQALAIIWESGPGAELRLYGAPTPFLEVVMHTARRTGVSDAVRSREKGPEDIVAAIDECDVGSCPIVGRSSRRSTRRLGTSSICREASPRSRGERLAFRISLPTTRYSILGWEMQRILLGTSLVSSTTLRTR